MRSRYSPGTSDGWSGPWSDEATATTSTSTPPPLVPEPMPEPTPEPMPKPTPEPMPEPVTNEVTGLVLSSVAVGQLVVTWTQPSDKPTDYRVTWAPDDEDFLSYAEDNTTRRGNSYPDGDTTTLTLTGLPGGVTYKVMMRARYHDDQTGQDSSGPWTGEVTQRVQNNPPAAPTGLSASEVSANSVTLRWTAPSGAGITGYRVLRGRSHFSDSSWPLQYQ